MSTSKKGNNSSKKMNAKPSKEEDDVCVVCFRPVEIYSVGDCDHPVCYECSTRMRVLIDRTECPICRKDMSQVVFVAKKDLAPFRDLNTRNMSFERRYAVFFGSDKEMMAYDRLLEHPCPTCPEPRVFKNFEDLKAHVSQQHQRYYCDLCVAYLKIFTRERRAYTRFELARHRRKGDPDDTSHRGHPLCEFCDIRYMDSDELFRHLRKDHFYCHFCDADGLHHYYDDYPALRDHFRGSHFLCEEGDCKNEQFTSVFRDKIDLQAHFLERHAENKRAARHARTVDIEFTVNHAPSLVHRDDRGRGRGGGRGRPSRSNWEDSPAEEVPPPPPPQHSIDINCVQDFPTLGNQTVEVPRPQPGRSFTVRASRGNVASMEEEFPALGNSSAAAPARSGAASSATTSVHLKVNAKKPTANDNSNKGAAQRGAVSIQYSRSAGGAEQKNQKGTSKNASNSAANVVSSKASNITLKSKSNKNNFGPGNRDNSSEDFPSLRQPSRSLTSTFGGSDSTNLAGAASTQASRNVSLASSISSTKVTSSVRAKDNKSNGFQKPPSGSDFPSLSSDTKQNGGMKNYHGMSKVTVPVNNSWTKTTEYVPAASVSKSSSGAQDSTASSSKGNNSSNNNNAKKKKNIITPSSATTNGTTQAKKKTLRLGNVFEASDGEEETEEPNLGITYAHSRKDYDVYNHVSKVPEVSSNIKMLSAEAFEARKKSELKIGALKTSVPKINSAGDFPSLGKSGNSSNGKKTSNKAESNGDGWANVTGKKPAPTKTSKAETGNFSNTDMTFHNSYGESFHISQPSDPKASKSATASKGKKDKSKNHKFIPPQNFEQRNQLLIKTISDHCGGNTDQFKQFKSLAVNLRSGSLEGRTYYQQCRQLMGKATLLSILPELLGLLPDISMQQAVFKAYKQTDDAAEGDQFELSECGKCGQVLRLCDARHHHDVHDKAEFPSLGSISLH